MVMRTTFQQNSQNVNNGYYNFSTFSDASITNGTLPVDANNVYVSVFSSGQVLSSLEPNRIGIAQIKSSATANSGAALIGTSSHVPAVGDTHKIWFKLPGSVSGTSRLYFGYLSGNTSAFTDGSGVYFTGTTMSSFSRAASVDTQQGNISLGMAGQWYTAQVKCISSTTVECTLYNSSGGAPYFTTTFNGNFGTSKFVGLVAYDTGTVASDLCFVDAMENRLVPRSQLLLP